MNNAGIIVSRWMYHGHFQLSMCNGYRYIDTNVPQLCRFAERCTVTCLACVWYWLTLPRNQTVMAGLYNQSKGVEDNSNFYANIDGGYLVS